MKKNNTPTQRAINSAATPPHDGRSGYIPLHAANASKQPRSMGEGFVVVALIATVLITAGIVYTLWNAGIIGSKPTTETEEVQEITTAEIDYGLPTVSDMTNATASSLTTLCESMGVTYYDATSDESKASGGIELIKLPEGVDLTTAGMWYLQGVENLSAEQAATLLHGSWRLSLAAGDSYDCRLKYAVFDQDEATAVAQAQEAVGLASAEVAEQGVDSNGNTYKQGTFEADGTTFNWRVASCPLEEIYSIEGLPDTASYVVVSITAS